MDAGFDLFGRYVRHAHGESHILVYCYLVDLERTTPIWLVERTLRRFILVRS